MYQIAIDAMGGDFAPDEVIKGALAAAAADPRVHVLLVGQKEVVEPKLKDLTYDKLRVTVIGAPEVIGTAEHPVQAIRTKKDSSLAVGMRMVRDGQADAFISSGNSGALMVGGQLIVGRRKGVDRAPFAHVVPTAKGPCLLLDCGANVDVRPEHLVTFARLGCEYASQVLGIASPRVGLVNIGAEEEKGNELTRAAYPLLAEAGDFGFIGNLEATALTAGEADVAVCDGFAGNLIIKLYEGLGSLMMGSMKAGLTATPGSRLGALLVKKSLRQAFAPYDAQNYGGAPVLGLKGLVLKTHGNAKAAGFANAVRQCTAYINQQSGGESAGE